MCIYYELIITMKLVNTAITSHSYSFAVKAFKMLTLSFCTSLIADNYMQLWYKSTDHTLSILVLKLQPVCFGKWIWSSFVIRESKWLQRSCIVIIVIIMRMALYCLDKHPYWYFFSEGMHVIFIEQFITHRSFSS